MVEGEGDAVECGDCAVAARIVVADLSQFQGGGRGARLQDTGDSLGREGGLEVRQGGCRVDLPLVGEELSGQPEVFGQPAGVVGGAR